MNLFVLAHSLEAKGILRLHSFKKVALPISAKLFRYEEILLLVCGEGGEAVVSSLAVTLSMFPNVRKVCNLGIAGGIGDFAVGDVVAMRHVYRWGMIGVDSANMPEFKSFSLEIPENFEGLTGFDNCITMHQRLLDAEHPVVKTGLVLGGVIDRELWHIAWVCHSFCIPLVAFKVISDLPREATGDLCARVQEDAGKWGNSLIKMYQGFLKIENEDKNHPEKINQEDELSWLWAHSGFYWTHSLQTKAKSLLKSLENKKEEPISQILPKLISRCGAGKGESPKERARNLISMLESRLDPFSARLQESFALLDQHLPKFWSVDYSNLEKDGSINLKFTLSFQTDPVKVVESMKQLELEERIKLLAGKSDALASDLD